MGQAKREPRRPGQPSWALALRVVALIAGVFIFGMAGGFGSPALLALALVLLAVAAVPYRWYPRPAPKPLTAVAEPGPVAAPVAESAPTRFYVAGDGEPTG